MRLPAESYQLADLIAEHLPVLRPAQARGLAAWVYGTILARSACQNAVTATLSALGHWNTLRAYLRELFYDGADKAAPCTSQIEVEACFAPLTRWLLSWWQADELALAVDATAHKDRVVALVVSALYRGAAIPIAWAVLPANKPAPWMPKILHLLGLLAPAIGPGMRVLVLADRGLWSPRLWTEIKRLGFHPVLRVNQTATFRPEAGPRQPARALVPGPGHAWVGRGVAFGDHKVRRAGTMVVFWQEGQSEPWVVLTDLAPEEVGIAWYGLRIWIELGFRALKGLGWQWERTRRTDPGRVARHWLVLAVATLVVMATGTRAEDAERLGVQPARLRTVPSRPSAGRTRRLSVFALGLARSTWQLIKGRLWRCLWLAPEPWPKPPPCLSIAYHAPP